MLWLTTVLSTLAAAVMVRVATPSSVPVDELLAAPLVLEQPSSYRPSIRR